MIKFLIQMTNATRMKFAPDDIKTTLKGQSDYFKQISKKVYLKLLTHVFEKFFMRFRKYDQRNICYRVKQRIFNIWLDNFSYENKGIKKLDVIKPSDNLKFEVKKNTYKTSISFELGKINEKKSYSVVSANVFNFGLLCSKKNKTIDENRKMLEIIDTMKILGF